MSSFNISSTFLDLFLCIKSVSVAPQILVLRNLALINISLAGISLRLGGNLTKGPYLPETLEGISKSTKAVFGKPQ